jgi:hypothetical protein
MRDEQKMMNAERGTMNEQQFIVHRSASRVSSSSLIPLLLLCLVMNARAVTLVDYGAQVGEAENVAARLIDLYDTTEESATEAAEFRRAETKLIAQLRAALPATEKVERDKGDALDVDNRWLAAELDAYEQLPTTPIKVRRGALLRIFARLHALYERLEETANTTSAQARDKTAEKGHLHAILQRPEYNQAPAQESALEQLWQRFARWLRNLIPHAKPLQPGTAHNLSRLARAFVYILCLVVIVFVLWRYGPRLLRRKLNQTRARQARIILGERLAADETPADLLSEAERLARAGDLRGAIRKAYIAVLFELGERKLLHLAPHKTNRDYLRHLRAEPRLLQAVQPLTAAYERHWYGLLPANDADWSEFQAGTKAVTSDK